MNRFPRVLAIGAHPDDVEIGMGGAVLAMREEGYEVWILDLTDGEPTPMGTPERRREEAMDISPYMERKLEAIRCYTSQFNVERGNLGLLEEVREENRYWGSLIGCAYGEPFACKEEIGLKGMGALV